jgi:acyl-CoA thioester hydrolase
VFSFPIRVYYEDTDAGGVVYYANYLRFMERARSEWMRSLGFEQDELARDPGVLFAVRSASLSFDKPARFNDVLATTVQIKNHGGASVTFVQTVERNGAVLCRGEVKVACLNAQTFQPCPIPEAIVSRFLQQEE